jgi:hypothetical protein
MVRFGQAQGTFSHHIRRDYAAAAGPGKRSIVIEDVGLG